MENLTFQVVFQGNSFYMNLFFKQKSYFLNFALSPLKVWGGKVLYYFNTSLQY